MTSSINMGIRWNPQAGVINTGTMLLEYARSAPRFCGRRVLCFVVLDRDKGVSDREVNRTLLRQGHLGHGRVVLSRTVQKYFSLQNHGSDRRNIYIYPLDPMHIKIGNLPSRRKLFFFPMTRLVRDKKILACPLRFPFLSRARTLFCSYIVFCYESDGRSSNPGMPCIFLFFRTFFCFFCVVYVDTTK